MSNMQTSTGFTIEHKMPITELLAHKEVKWPVTDEQAGTPAANVITIAVVHKLTYVTTPAIAAATTINVTDENGEAEVGDELIIEILLAGTNRVITLGTLLSSDVGTITCVASKTSVLRFVYNGTTFREVSRSMAT